jgi:HD-GYP domain-containing protein (c-di-GMP phosphodiesterase class II)
MEETRITVMNTLPAIAPFDAPRVPPVIAGLAPLVHILEAQPPSANARRLSRWGAQVAAALGLDHECQHNVEIACLLHDLGKVVVPDAILHKPGPLTAGERRVMEMHPEHGWSLLRRVPDLHLAALFVRHHHERMDGSGYPRRLSAPEIPLGARITAVVDAFEGMISDRNYRAGLTAEHAVARLMMAAGRHYDPDVVRHFADVALA